MLGIFRTCSQGPLCCHMRDVLSAAAAPGLATFGLDDSEYAACWGDPIGVAPPSMVAVAASASPGEGTAHNVMPTHHQPRQKGLQVPSSFRQFQLNTIVNEQSAKRSVRIMESQRAVLQGTLKRFTKDMMHGALLDVVLDDGTHVESFCMLDTQITHLAIRVGTTLRTVDLAQIENVCGSEDMTRLRTTHKLCIDELCATLVLKGSQFVTFRFENALVRDYFTMCLGILRMRDITSS